MHHRVSPDTCADIGPVGLYLLGRWRLFRSRGAMPLRLAAVFRARHIRIVYEEVGPSEFSFCSSRSVRCLRRDGLFLEPGGFAHGGLALILYLRVVPDRLHAQVAQKDAVPAMRP